MGKMKLKLQTGYIVDAIIQVKKNRFNEEFTTIEEVDMIKSLIQKRFNQKGLNVKFVDTFFTRYFNIIDGVIIKASKESESLEVYICDEEVYKIIYDEEFIYLCLYKIMLNKRANSIEHTCTNCNSYCCGGLSPEQAENCNKWTHSVFVEKNRVLKLKKIIGE